MGCNIASFVEVSGEILKNFFGFTIASRMYVVTHHIQFVSTTNIVMDTRNYNFTYTNMSKWWNVSMSH